MVIFEHEAILHFVQRRVLIQCQERPFQKQWEPPLHQTCNWTRVLRAKLLWLYSWSNNSVLLVCLDMLALQRSLRGLKTAWRMNLGLPHCRLCLFEAPHNPLTEKPHSASYIMFWRRERENVRESQSESGRKGHDQSSHTGLCCVRCVLIALIWGESCFYHSFLAWTFGLWFTIGNQRWCDSTVCGLDADHKPQEL